MKTYPLVSIVTVNYKQSQVTNELMESLQQLSWPNFELLVVDNDSGEMDLKLLRLDFSFMKLIRSKKNLGFAGGNNLGILQAKGDYILLLNNDTEVDKHFLEPMVELMESNPKIGAVSPKIVYFDQPDIVQYAGFTPMNPFTIRMKGLGFKQKDEGSFNQIMQTHFAHGCAMMVSRAIIQKVGLMPEDYFLYYEEHDWSTAIKRAGFIIYYQPKSLVFHKESMSVKKNSPLKTYFINRNRILYMKRNFSLPYKILAIIYLIFISFPKNTLAFYRTHEKEHQQAYFDAILWNITGKTKAKWDL
jgi:GT2 family glycosyltransferase